MVNASLKITFKFKFYLIEILEICIEYMSCIWNEMGLDTKINKSQSCLEEYDLGYTIDVHKHGILECHGLQSQRNTGLWS